MKSYIESLSMLLPGNKTTRPPRTHFAARMGERDILVLSRVEQSYGFV